MRASERPAGIDSCGRLSASERELSSSNHPRPTRVPVKAFALAQSQELTGSVVTQSTEALWWEGHDTCVRRPRGCSPVAYVNDQV